MTKVRKEVIHALGLWEQLHNPYFKPTEFDGVRNAADSSTITSHLSFPQPVLTFFVKYSFLYYASFTDKLIS